MRVPDLHCAVEKGVALMRYTDYLRSPAWRRRRDDVLARDGRRCQDCGSQIQPLHVHHLTYEDFGHEPHWQLLTLCVRCHDDRHATTINGWCGASWDTLGSDTEWRRDNWPELRNGSPGENFLIKHGPASEREEFFYAETIYGDFGGDARLDSEQFYESMARD